MKPAYYKDVLKDLCFQDGASLRAICIQESINYLQDVMARASDEIRRLREENKKLRKQIKQNGKKI